VYIKASTTIETHFKMGYVMEYTAFDIVLKTKKEGIIIIPLSGISYIKIGEK
jgi:hypothetical protein